MSDTPAEADMVAIFRADAKVRAYPEILEVEILSDLRIEQLVLFLLRDATTDDDDIGDFLTLRQFEFRVSGWDWGQRVARRYDDGREAK